MDVDRIRKDFPILEKEMDGKPLIYLDTACQSLRPIPVIKAMESYYEEYPACAGRSVHKLATKVSIEVDEARERIARFINARRVDEICFTRNCTEALNTVIFGVGLKRGETVLATDKEHNSLHVPLLVLKDSMGIKYGYVPARQDETFDLEKFKMMMSKQRPRLVAMCHTNNINGTTIPAKEICEIAHDHRATVLLDGAQFVPYGGVDIQEMDADFYAFSSHKMCGPAGTGVLTGKYELLSKLRPLTYGGHGVSGSTRNEAVLLPPPEKFEAGLQNYPGMIGSGAAAEYLENISSEEIRDHVKKLNSEATRMLAESDSIKIIEPREAGLRKGILSFNIKGRNPHDIAMVLDHSENIMIRSGMHCVHSWFNDRHIDGSARASFYIYNTIDEAMAFADAVLNLV